MRKYSEQKLINTQLEINYGNKDYQEKFIQ